MRRQDGINVLRDLFHRTRLPGNLSIPPEVVSAVLYGDNEDDSAPPAPINPRLRLVEPPKDLDALLDADAKVRTGRSFWYLATPYSRFAGGLTAAFVEACEVTAKLIEAKIPVFSPIAHMHSVAMAGAIVPLDHAIWLPADAPMMEAAHGLIVCEMEGFAESVGIAHEIAAFEAAGKPIVRLDPEFLPRAAGEGGHAKHGGEGA